MEILKNTSLVASAVATDYTQIYGDGKTQLKLATGSPGELGLLKVISEVFCSQFDAHICWIKAGSGESLRLLKEGKIDISMVHAPKAEKEAVKDGWATHRTLIGSNEFYIIGDKDDSAGIRGSFDASQAYKKIAQKQALFYTRADNSGTHKKELSIWKKARISPSGSWYVENRDFMLATLKKADETKGYFMTDSSTFKVAKKDLKNSVVLFSGDKMLINTYVAMCGADPKPLSVEFIKFLASQEGQSIIKCYGIKEYQEPLYEGIDYAKEYFEE